MAVSYAPKADAPLIELICGPLGGFARRGAAGLYRLPVSVTKYTSSPRTRAFTIPASSTLTVS